MLDDEIRSFIDEVRKEPTTPWPKDIPSEIAEIPFIREARLTYEESKKLIPEDADRMEALLLHMYELGADDEPGAIDVFDKIISIIRQKNASPSRRFHEIGQLMLKLQPPKLPK